MSKSSKILFFVAPLVCLVAACGLTSDRDLNPESEMPPSADAPADSPSEDRAPPEDAGGDLGREDTGSGSSCAVFVEEHSCYTLDAWMCPEGTTMVIDPSGCGCGCVASDTPTLPELPSHAECKPFVEEHSCYTLDDWLWSCPEGTTPLVDPGLCGCGCVAHG